MPSQTLNMLNTLLASVEVEVTSRMTTSITLPSWLFEATSPHILIPVDDRKAVLYDEQENVV